MAAEMVAEVNDVQVPIDPDDDERNEVDSDNELGPEEVDEDDDAMPPEGLAEYAKEQDDGAAIAGADDANAAAPPEQHPERMLALALSASDIISLKVDQLKMHLKWRGQSLDGLKAELTEITP